MKECKCGRIPPCYSGKKFRIHEELEKIKAGDETHDMVYELNKQMCDIDKHLSEAGYFRMICDGQIETRKKLKDMKEKKTKKMTKAEAFEYLKNAKIYVGRKRDEVLRKLFEVGLEWSVGGQEVDLGWESGEVYGLLSYDGKLRWAKSRMVKWFDSLAMPRELRADDVLSIEIIEEKKGDERKGEILDEIAKLGEKISDFIEEYGGDIVIEIDQYEVLLRDSGDILYRK